jgi:hypothetical protein
MFEPFELQNIQVTKRLKSVVDDMIDDAEDEFVDIDYMFGYACALCHDGGDLLWYCLMSSNSYINDGIPRKFSKIFIFLGFLV